MAQESAPGREQAPHKMERDLRSGRCQMCDKRRVPTPDLERITMPCALLYGTDDRSASREPLAQLLERDARLTHLEVPGTHHPPERQPERPAEALRQVLARSSTPASEG